MRSVAYETVDVFTTTRFGGNPLAVIPDGQGLSTEEMLAIAREFNYSETTFVLPPKDPANTAQVRIFTPVMEIPFAGHPNVGTAFVLAQHAAARGERPERFRFEEGAGLVEIALSDGGQAAELTAPQPFARGQEIDPADIAACLSLDAAEVVTRHHPPMEGSVGLPFIFAELASLEMLGRTKTNVAAFEAAHERYGIESLRFSIYAYVRLGEGPERLQGRMFAPLTGVAEDPATGSASGALGGLLASLDPRAAAEIKVSIAQGVEMGRPSRIEVTAVRRGGQVVEVRVAGRSVPVMAGTISL